MGAEGPHGQGRAPGPGTCAPPRLRFSASFASFCFCLPPTVSMYSPFVFSACGGGAGPGPEEKGQGAADDDEGEGLDHRQDNGQGADLAGCDVHHDDERDDREDVWCVQRQGWGWRVSLSCLGRFLVSRTRSGPPGVGLAPVSTGDGQPAATATDGNRRAGRQATQLETGLRGPRRTENGPAVAQRHQNRGRSVSYSVVETRHPRGTSTKGATSRGRPSVAWSVGRAADTVLRCATFVGRTLFAGTAFRGHKM